MTKTSNSIDFLHQKDGWEQEEQAIQICFTEKNWKFQVFRSHKSTLRKLLVRVKKNNSERKKSNTSFTENSNFCGILEEFSRELKDPTKLKRY